MGLDCRSIFRRPVSGQLVRCPSPWRPDWSVPGCAVRGTPRKQLLGAPGKRPRGPGRGGTRCPLVGRR
eukprot:13978592-Alexandrium_andersonii.AAC.1